MFPYAITVMHADESSQVIEAKTFAEADTAARAISLMSGVSVVTMGAAPGSTATRITKSYVAGHRLGSGPDASAGRQPFRSEDISYLIEQ